MKVTPDYAAILRRERLSAGLTQYDMADALGMAQGHYSLLERGKMRYTVLHLIRAKRRLGVPYEVLTGERKVGGQSCRTQD